MIIQSSISSKPLKAFTINEAFSGFTFYQFVCEAEEYPGTPEAKVTVEGIGEFNMTITGCEITTDPTNGSLVCKVGGVPTKDLDLLKVHIRNYSSTPVCDMLGDYGFEIPDNHYNAQASFTNLTQSDAGCVVFLANSEGAPAFVDFNHRKIVMYQDLYKKDPVQVQAGFMRILQNYLNMGIITFSDETNNVGTIEHSRIFPLGKTINSTKGFMDAVVKNFNSISRLFSTMQTFTSTVDNLGLGVTVVSSLTHSRCVVVAKATTYVERGPIFNYYVV